MEHLPMMIIRRDVKLSDKKYIKDFVVKLNWIGIFEITVGFIGVILSVLLFKYMCSYIQKHNEKITTSLAALSIPFFLLVLCLWLVMNYLFTGIEVHDNTLLIKRAFKKNKTIDISEVISYSNTDNIQKGHRYSSATIYFGENDSIEVRSDIYKNYDLLVYYLKKNVAKHNNKERD